MLKTAFLSVSGKLSRVLKFLSFAKTPTYLSVSADSWVEQLCKNLGDFEKLRVIETLAYEFSTLDPQIDS